MGRIIAIANQKGGVGKTTTAINLAACLAEAGKKILAIDLDPQGNMTSGLGVDKNEVENTVYQLMLDECTIKESMVHTVVDNLELIASNVNLAGAEIELLGIADKEYILKNAVDYIKEDYDDGRLKYEGEAYYNQTKYEFELDAATGAFTDWEEETGR